MVKEIVVVPDPILRKKSLMVKEITPKIEDLANAMVDFMDEHSKDDNCPIGLSAVQFGQPIRMIAFRRSPGILDRDNIQILINPELVYVKKQYTVKEGCLSLPKKLYQLRRFKMAKIRGMTLDGNTRSFRARDLLAQVFQHEMNHLDGVLVDKIGKLMVKR